MITFSPAFLTVLCLSTSLLLLSLCTWRLYRAQQRDAASVERLEDVLTRMTREVVAANARVARMERTVQHMGDRQDTMECRTAGGQRIESAVLVARQGAASVSVLKDLGLSEAEASLLLRLHTKQTDQDVGARPPSGRNKPAAIVSLSKDDDHGAHPGGIEALADARIPPSQAASLARLLANAAGEREPIVA